MVQRKSAVIVQSKVTNNNYAAILGCPVVNPKADVSGFDKIILNYNCDSVPAPKCNLSGEVWNTFDVGDKVACLKLAKDLPIRVPRFLEPPLIVKKVRGTQAGDKLHHDKFAVEFIPTKGKLFYSVRFCIVGETLTEWFCRPSSKWNIHTATQNPEHLRQARRDFKNYKWDMQGFVKSIKDVFGLGFFVVDCVWDTQDLWFCEIGHKIYDHTYRKWLASKGNPIQLKPKAQLFQEIRDACLQYNN